MAIKDIKYVMSADDSKVQKAISRTVDSMKAVSKKTGSPVNEAALQKSMAGVSNAFGDAARQIDQVLGGALANPALGAALANGFQPAVSGIGSVLVAGLGIAGIQAGVQAGKGFLAGSQAEFTAAGAGLREIMARSMAGFGAALRQANVTQNITQAFESAFARIKGTAMAAALRKSIAGQMAGFSLLGNSVAETLKGGFAKALGAGGEASRPLRRWIANQMAGVFVGLPAIIGNKMAGVRGAAATLGASVAAPIRSGFASAFAGLSAIAAPVMIAVGAVVTAGVGIITAAFAGIAAYANSAWSEVEDGVMRVQATLVSFGASVEDAFSDKVVGAVMGVADTLAVAYGVMAGDTSAAVAELTKNGIDLNAALAHQGLLHNIATVNGMTQAQAAKVLVAAWNGEARALKEVGIRIEDTGDTAKNAALLMEKLKQRYGEVGLSQPFIDDNPINRATAALNLLWVQLGKALDPTMTALAQRLSDVLLGIAEHIKTAGSSDFIPNLEGVIAAIGATISTVVTATRFVWNVLQMAFASVMAIGKTIWNGLQFGWAWIQEKFAEWLNKVGMAVKLMPFTGDAGEKIQAMAASASASAQQGMEAAGANMAADWQTLMESYKTDIQDMARAATPGGGTLADLEEKGRAARERAQAEAQEAAKNAPDLGESEKAKEDRLMREAQEAEKYAKQQRQTFEQNQRRAQEMARYQEGQRGVTITMMTPNRQVATLRHGRRR